MPSWMVINVRGLATDSFKTALYIAAISKVGDELAVRLNMPWVVTWLIMSFIVMFATQILEQFVTGDNCVEPSIEPVPNPRSPSDDDDDLPPPDSGKAA